MKLEDIATLAADGWWEINKSITVRDTLVIDRSTRIVGSAWLYVRDSAWLDVRDSARLYVSDSAWLDVSDSAWLDVSDSARLYVRDSAWLDVSDSARLYVSDSARLYVSDSARLYVSGSARLYVRDSARLYVSDSAWLDVRDSAWLDVRDSARITLTASKHSAAPSACVPPKCRSRRRRTPMADLHPEVLKEIEAGPQSICDHYVEHIPVMRNESLEEFARRIAALAVQLEREDCAKVCDEYPRRDPAEDGDGYWAAQDCAAAIRRRGKP